MEEENDGVLFEHNRFGFEDTGDGSLSMIFISRLKSL